MQSQLAGARSRPRLGVWVRLGIVLTVVWMVGVPIWQFTQVNENRRVFAQRMYDTCRNSAFGPNATRYPEECWPEYLRFHPPLKLDPDMVEVLSASGLAAAIAAAFAWAIAGILWWVARWVLRGRR